MPFISLNKVEGVRLYFDNCSGCHQSSGRGIANVVPPLDGNPTNLAPDVFHVIKVFIRCINAHNSLLCQNQLG